MIKGLTKATPPLREHGKDKGRCAAPSEQSSGQHGETVDLHSALFMQTRLFHITALAMHSGATMYTGYWSEAHVGGTKFTWNPHPAKLWLESTFEVCYLKGRCRGFFLGNLVLAKVAEDNEHPNLNAPLSIYGVWAQDNRLKIDTETLCTPHFMTRCHILKGNRSQRTPKSVPVLRVSVPHRPSKMDWNPLKPWAKTFPHLTCFCWIFC